MRNPFLNRGFLNQSLDHEHCQRILFTALRIARRNGLTPSGSLDGILKELRVLERYAGSSIYLLDPMEVDRLFRGVSLATYQTIQWLYVDRLGRSLTTVTQILRAMAEKAGMSALTSEAIWAIGVYLSEQRDKQIAVSVERSTNPWILTSLHLNDRVVLMDGSAQSLTIAMVIDSVNERVLSFRICSSNKQDVAHALAVYDALLLHRTPAQFAPAGLSWSLPNRLHIIDGTPPGLEVICRELDIVLELGETPPPLMNAIEAAWYNRPAELFTRHQFQLTFDTYLHRLHGFGPLRTRRQKNYEFAHLLGYNRDPAWQLSALRSLLPIHHATIEATGDVVLEGLHFDDNLLMLFPGMPVTVRYSEESEATAWVYLNSEILCEAKARELRRPDGTYRTRLPSRRSRFTD
jgi:hypothetical protein